MSMSLRVEGDLRTPKPSAWTWRKASADWADQIRPPVLDRLRNSAPVGIGAGAGRYRNSITASRKVGGERTTLSFAAHTSYAPYVVPPTRPHIIRPKAARALHWPENHFATIVHHPGTKGNDFPDRTMRAMREIIAAQFRVSVMDALS